ncbi:MAG: glycosyltransferase [Kiritimatiellia bacterium]
MKILWFPRLQYDVDRLHLTTWKEMANALGRQGHAVRVAVAGIPKSETPAGWIRLPLLPVKGLRLPAFWLSGYAAFLWQFLRFRPDLVLLDVYTAGFACPWIWLARRTAWVLDQRTPIAHTSLRRGPFRRAAERALTATAIAFARRWFNGMTTITEAFRAHVSETFGVPLDRIGVWGSGVDAERFDPARCVPAERPEDLQGRFVVFQHGEWSSNRGLLETVRALREPGLENAALVLLGEGPAQEEILRQARKCGVEARVRLRPPVPHAEIPAQIAACDCAVMAYPVDEYWNGNHPIKFVEALAMGKVVVCTPIAVVREAGPAARFLEVIPDNRPESIAAGIRACMAAPDLNERGREGIAFVRAHATWDAQAARLLAFVRARTEPAHAP